METIYKSIQDLNRSSFHVPSTFFDGKYSLKHDTNLALPFFKSRKICLIDAHF